MTQLGLEPGSPHGSYSESWTACLPGKPPILACWGLRQGQGLPEATLLVPQKVVQPHTLWAALGTPGAQAGLLPIPWEKGGCPCLVSLSHRHSSGGSSPKNRVIQRPSTYPHGSLWLRPCGRPSISFGGDSFSGKNQFMQSVGCLLCRVSGVQAGRVFFAGAQKGHSEGLPVSLILVL